VSFQVFKPGHDPSTNPAAPDLHAPSQQHVAQLALPVRGPRRIPLPAVDLVIRAQRGRGVGPEVGAAGEGDDAPGGARRLGGGQEGVLEVVDERKVAQAAGCVWLMLVGFGLGWGWW